MGLIKVVHPFPSALNAVAAMVVASIAGGSAEITIRLALAMLGLQFAIGAANDINDVASDAVSKVGKPIPAGLITRPAAAAVAMIAGGLGLLLAAPVSPPALAVGVVGLGDGLLYDLRLKGTAFAWVPFAAGVCLLPVYAWWGAAGYVPPAFLVSSSWPFFAGSTLALANAYADVDRDQTASTVSVATLLGPRRTLVANGALLGLVQIVALATTVAVAGTDPMLLVEVAGSTLGWVGLGLAAVRDEQARPLVWEVQAVGIVVLGGSWLAVLDAAGSLRG